MAERQSFQKDVARYKMANNMPRIQKEREEEIQKRWLKEAKKLSVDPELAKSVFKNILKNSHKIQKKIMKK